MKHLIMANSPVLGYGGKLTVQLQQSFVEQTNVQ